jgi:hypothetical protein
MLLNTLDKGNNNSILIQMSYAKTPRVKKAIATVPMSTFLFIQEGLHGSGSGIGIGAGGFTTTGGLGLGLISFSSTNSIGNETDFPQCSVSLVESN